MFERIVVAIAIANGIMNDSRELAETPGIKTVIK